MDRIRKNFSATPVILLDSGNFTDNPSPGGEVKTRGLVEGMARLGYRAANVGERDLITGYDDLLRRTAKADFPFISANIVRKDNWKPVFAPYRVLSVTVPGASEPVRVGVIGVTRYNPVFRKPGPGGAALAVEEPSKALARYVPEVRAKAELVVLLAAIHRDDARAIARAIPGIDLILGAYGAIYTVREEVVGSTRIVYCGSEGKRISENRIFLSADGHPVSMTSYLHFLTRRYPEDPAMLKFAGGVLQRADDAAQKAQAQPAVLPGGSANPGARPPGR